MAIRFEARGVSFRAIHATDDQNLRFEWFLLPPRSCLSALRNVWPFGLTETLKARQLPADEA